MGLEMQMDHVTAERDAGDRPGGPDRRRRLPRPGGGPRRHRRAALRRVGPPAHPRVPLGARGLPGRPPHAPAPAATTTPSPTPASTWPPTGPWSRPTRSASGCPRRSSFASEGDRDRSHVRTRGSTWTGSSRPWSSRWPTSTGPRPSTPTRVGFHRRRRPPGRRGLPGRPADPDRVGLLHLAHEERAGGRHAAGAAPGGARHRRGPAPARRAAASPPPEVFHFEEGVQADGPDPGREPTTGRSSRSAIPTGTAGWSRRSPSRPR